MGRPASVATHGMGELIPTASIGRTDAHDPSHALPLTSDALQTWTIPIPLQQTNGVASGAARAAVEWELSVRRQGFVVKRWSCVSR